MSILESENKEFSLILEKYIKKEKINHAYMIETNVNERLEIAKELVKKIISFDENSSIENLNNNFDLEILRTDSQTIKKEEIINLKEKFKTKSIYNSKRIYIIEESEKLNSSSANTLLKFLEEPEENIIAILVTKNRNLVIDTIVSRCQVIRFYQKESDLFECDLEYSDAIFDFIMTIEEKKEKSIAYINNIDLKKYIDRQNISDFLIKLLYVYNDVFHKKIDLPIEYYFNYEDKIEIISKNNTLNEIKNKINAINECIERNKYNANIRLLLDKLIIMMSGVDTNV